MKRFTIYRHCKKIGKKLLMGEVCANANAVSAFLYKNIFLVVKIKYC
jgi:hypothetical protein